MEKEKKDRLILYFRKLFALFLYCFVLCSIIPPVPSETGDDVTTTVASIIAAIVCIIANVIGNYKKNGWIWYYNYHLSFTNIKQKENLEIDFTALSHKTDVDTAIFFFHKKFHIEIRGGPSKKRYHELSMEILKALREAFPDHEFIYKREQVQGSLLSI